MADKVVVLVTGGNTGIGYETVKAFYDSPNAYTILMGSRSLEKAKDAISTLQREVSSSKSEVVAVQIDIEDDASINNCFKEVESKWGRVDALVNNAGAAFDPVMKEKPGPAGIREAWDHSYSLNVTSTEVFTQAFIPLLLKSKSPTPRLLFVTSGLSSLERCAAGEGSVLTEAPPKGWPKPSAPSMIAYRSSKVALNMLMLEWTRLLQVDGVKVFCISPGLLATGLAGLGKENMKKMGAGDASLGGTFIRDVVEGKRDADAGKVVSRDGVQSW